MSTEPLRISLDETEPAKPLDALAAYEQTKALEAAHVKALRAELATLGARCAQIRRVLPRAPKGQGAKKAKVAAGKV